MINKTKGQIEAEISIALTNFEKKYIGRGPREARTFIIEDMILIRLKGVLTPAEEKLASDIEGAQLFKQWRRKLIESSRLSLEKIVQDIVDMEIISLHTDISSQTGERIFVLIMSNNLESEIEKANLVEKAGK
jgi:uncharacterized protein YbcI